MFTILLHQCHIVKPNKVHSDSCNPALDAARLEIGWINRNVAVILKAFRQITEFVLDYFVSK